MPAKTMLERIEEAKRAKGSREDKRAAAPENKADQPTDDVEAGASENKADSEPEHKRARRARPE